MKKHLNRFLTNQSFTAQWLPVFLWASVIFFFSSLPQQKVGETFISDFIIKKIAHISEYAILFALTFRATGKKFIQTFVFVIFYAILDEIHQGFVPGRTPKIYDVLGFDLTGANIAAFMLWKLQQARPNKQKK